MRKFVIPSIILALTSIAILIPYFIKVVPLCKSQFGECPSELNTKIAVLGNKNYRFAKSELIKILKNDPLVSDFSFQFKLPNTFLINVLTKKSEFAIFDKLSSKTFILDKEGKILGEDNGTSLPKIVQDGNTPNLYALNALKGVNEMYGVKTGEIEGDGLVIEVPVHIRVIFPLEDGDTSVLLGSLRLIYSKITTGENAGKYSEIDLRFKNPVLR